MDLHDNVDFRLFNCKFFNNQKKFFKFVKKEKVDFVVVCTPSYKHLNIYQWVLPLCNVIVETTIIKRYSI